MEAYSLFEVNQYIRRVIALNFEEPIWIECEINQVSNSRGNLYIQLIQEDENGQDVIAKASGTIWYRQFLFIKKKLNDLTDAILTAGVKVKIKAQVDFNERYGFSLNILDIDPAYTFGQFEITRQKIIEKLKAKNLIDKNAGVPVPTVIQKIAVISSETAAGYQDFMSQLSENMYGYDFEISLYQAAMQGQKTEREVVAALQEAKKNNYDVICIIRGGGSKLDLAAFDNYNIAFEIAASPIPVLTGIGHDIDETVTDIVANQVLKTPTAVADFIIEHNSQFEGELLGLMQLIEQEVQYKLASYEQALQLMEEKIKTAPKARLQLLEHELFTIHSNLFNTGHLRIKEHDVALDNITNILKMLEPKNILKRGFVLVKEKGKYKTRANQINKTQNDLVLEFYDEDIIVKKQ